MNSLEQKNDYLLIFVIVIFIFLVGIFIGINFSSLNVTNPVIDEPLFYNEVETHSDNSNIDMVNVKSISNLIQPPIVTEIKNEELIQFALDKINQDRQDHGLSPVFLGNNNAAQHHAQDMFNLKYFSHWNSVGVKPYVTYSQNGGRNYVQENIAVSWCEGITCNLDPRKQIEKLEYSMMYDDASSNWGHRDAILNRDATTINIGLSFDTHSFYYVQHFETTLVAWQEFTLTSDGMLNLSGNLPKDYQVESITVFADPKSISVSAEDLKTKNPYNEKSYDQGTLVGILLKPPPLLSFYQECAPGKIKLTSEDENQCIRYETFKIIQDKNNVKITANISNWLEDDQLKTIYVNLLNEKKDLVPASSVTLKFISNQ